MYPPGIGPRIGGRKQKNNLQQGKRKHKSQNQGHTTKEERRQMASQSLDSLLSEKSHLQQIVKKQAQQLQKQKRQLAVRDKQLNSHISQEMKFILEMEEFEPVKCPYDPNYVPPLNRTKYEFIIYILEKGLGENMEIANITVSLLNAESFLQTRIPFSIPHKSTILRIFNYRLPILTQYCNTIRIIQKLSDPDLTSKEVFGLYFDETTLNTFIFNAIKLSNESKFEISYRGQVRKQQSLLVGYPQQVSKCAEHAAEVIDDIIDTFDDLIFELVEAGIFHCIEAVSVTRKLRFELELGIRTETGV